MYTILTPHILSLYTHADAPALAPLSQSRGAPSLVSTAFPALDFLRRVHSEFECAYTHAIYPYLYLDHSISIYLYLYLSIYIYMYNTSIYAAQSLLTTAFPALDFLWRVHSEFECAHTHFIYLSLSIPISISIYMYNTCIYVAPTLVTTAFPALDFLRRVHSEFECALHPCYLSLSLSLSLYLYLSLYLSIYLYLYV